MSIGTFGSFTQARLGIYAAQSGLSVTGNNIANINTHGYTRQHLDQSSFYAGGSDRYYGRNDIRVGNGVLCTGISQMRDPYLDIRYRNEVSNAGYMDSKLSGLNDIKRILDEVGKGDEAFGVLGAQFNDFFKQLQQLSSQAGHEEYDIQVRSSADSLVKLFNSYAAQLSQAEKNAHLKFNQDIDKVNNILTSIRDLNTSIRKAQIHGDNALELRDERNVLIDELSTYMKIDVKYTMEDIGAGIKVEKLSIMLGDANPDHTIPSDTATLVDGSYATQLSVPDKIEQNGQQVDNQYLQIQLNSLKDSKGRVMPNSKEVLLHDNDILGSLQAQREIITEAGEFTPAADIQNVDPDAARKRGIPYYQKTLDLLARKFAETFNNANQGFVHNEQGQYVTKDGTVITDAAGNPITVNNQMDDALKQDLLNKGGQLKGGPLFSNHGDSDDTKDITASNISISKKWSTGPLIVNSYVQHGSQPIGSTANDNIQHMLVLMNEKMDYKPSDLDPNLRSDVMFNGDFNGMWIRTGAVLGSDMMSTTTQLDTFYSSSVELDTSRSSVSSVDLNDEAMNLMQYSKSYNAACRLMTTLDSILDKLINGTGMTT